MIVYVSTMTILYLLPSFHNNGVIKFFIYRNNCIRLQWITFLFRSAHHWRSLLHRQTHCPRVSTFLHPDVAHCTTAWAHKGEKNNNTSSSSSSIIIIFLPFTGDINYPSYLLPSAYCMTPWPCGMSFAPFLIYFKKKVIMNNNYNIYMYVCNIDIYILLFIYIYIN